MRHHAILLVMIQPSLHIKPPKCVCYIHVWVSWLENQHTQSCRCKSLLTTPSSAAVSAMHLTCYKVPIWVDPSSVSGRWRWILGTILHGVSLRRPSSSLRNGNPRGAATSCLLGLAQMHHGNWGTPHQLQCRIQLTADQIVCRVVWVFCPGPLLVPF